MYLCMLLPVPQVTEYSSTLANYTVEKARREEYPCDPCEPVYITPGAPGLRVLLDPYHLHSRGGEGGGVPECTCICHSRYPRCPGTPPPWPPTQWRRPGWRSNCVYLYVLLPVLQVSGYSSTLAIYTAEEARMKEYLCADSALQRQK